MAGDELPEPDLLIVDAHHHLWEAVRLEGLGQLITAPDYLMADLRADVGSGHRVERTVFVECTVAYRTDGPDALRPVGETEWVAGLGDDLVGAIVGYADLTLGAGVGEVLDAHLEAGNGRFRGIRHATAWDASPEVRNAHTNPPAHLMGDHRFGAGVAALGGRGLSFDAWLYFHQIPELTDLARAHPEVVMVLDHLGAPLGIGPYTEQRDEVLAAWIAALVDLARCENVVVKLGGIGMPLYGFDWHRRPGGVSAEEMADAWGPHVRRVIELFGVDRCMFESNFPVDARSCTYRELWSAFKVMTSDATPDERVALFSGTARRVYRLE